MFKPLHNLVTVVVDQKETMTSGGLVLPDNFQDVFITGAVRAVGPGRWCEGAPHRIVPDVEPGDRVLVAQHVQQGPNGARRAMSYPEFDDGGVKCVLVNDSDILGIVERATSETGSTILKLAGQGDANVKCLPGVADQDGLPQGFDGLDAGL